MRSESVCGDEVAAFEIVLGRLSGLEECVGDEVVSGCMSLFTLGCRQGLAVCGEGDGLIVLSLGLLVRWYEHASGSCGEAELMSGGAIGVLRVLVCDGSCSESTIRWTSCFGSSCDEGLEAVDRRCEQQHYCAACRADV